MEEIAAKAIIGMPVYSINEGEAIGFVKNIILDPINKELLALAVDRRGWYRDPRIIAFSRLKTIGQDAITIAEKNFTERVANLPKMVKYMDQPSHIVGNRVISDDGHTLGKVDEYYLNTTTGKISRLDVSGGIKGNMLSGKVAIKGDYIMTIGGAAIMVNHSCFNDLEEIDSTLKINLQAAKEKTGQAWQSTISTSKKLGESFAAKINEIQQTAKKNKELNANLNEQAKAEIDLELDLADEKQPILQNLKSKMSLKNIIKTVKSELNEDVYAELEAKAALPLENPSTQAIVDKTDPLPLEPKNFNPTIPENQEAAQAEPQVVELTQEQTKPEVIVDKEREEKIEKVEKIEKPEIAEPDRQVLMEDEPVLTGKK